MPFSSAADETREIFHAALANLADDQCVYLSGDQGNEIVCALAMGGPIASQWTGLVWGLQAFADHNSPQAAVDSD